MRLPNKVAIITGGGSGMGRATAILFAKEGAKVAVVDINEEMGHESIDLVKKKGEEAVFIYADVTKTEQVKLMIAKVVEKFGKVDLLANFIGIWRHGTILDTDEDIWDRVINVDLRAVYLCCKYCIPEMIKGGGGTIINISSEAGLIVWKNQIAYNVAKSAVISLTKSIALDHASQNIRANVICPGTTETPMPLSWIAEQPDPQKARRSVEEVRPANRLGKPEEIAYGVLYLASDESPYATGAILSIDGGSTVK